jgi:hypothetical protein
VPESVARGWERYCEGGERREEDGVEEKGFTAAAANAAAVVVEKKTRNFELVRVVEGRHLWPLDKQHKSRWLFEIANRMASDLGLPGPRIGEGRESE